MDVNPADVRPDSGPLEDSVHRMSHAGSDDTEKQVSLVHEPVESNPVPTVNLVMMHQFTFTFRLMRESLGLSREEVCSTLRERCREDISPMWITHLENFGVFYDNMCELKSLLERWLDTARTTTYSSQNHEMSGDFFNENLGNSSSAGIIHRMSQEVGEDKNDEDSREFRNPMVSSQCKATTNDEAVQTCSTKKSYTHIASCFNDPATSIKSLYSGRLSPVNQSIERTEEGISLQDMQKFVNDFKKRRLELGLSQEDVGQQLAKLYGRRIPRMWIAEIERFNAFFKQMCQLKPLLLEWMTGYLGRMK